MDLKWYIVHTYSGFENRVKTTLEERIKKAGQEDSFGQTLVPTEQVVELRKGQKKTSTRKFFPARMMLRPSSRSHRGCTAQPMAAKP